MIKKNHKDRILSTNKDENVHRFALSAIRGEHLERERKSKRERESFWILYTGYLLEILLQMTLVLGVTLVTSVTKKNHIEPKYM